MQFSHDMDRRVWSNVETVRLRSTRNTGDLEDTIAGVLRAELTFAELADSGGGYVGADVAWMVQQALLATGWQIKPGDVVTDSDQINYTVLTVHGVLRDGTGYTHWRVTSRALSIAFGLTDTISIERNHPTYDAAASKVPAWTTLYAAFKARFNEISGSPADERGKRVTRRQYHVFLSRTVEVTTDDRVKDAEGNYYSIDSYTTSSLNQLPTLTCTRIAG